MTVYKAINQVQSELAEMGISKSRRNQQGAGYNFRGIDDIYNTVSPLLSKHGLCILPRVLKRECVERETKAGGAIFYTTVEVEFDFVCAEDGSKHIVKTFGEAMDTSDKSTNKAMSAAYKYACLQAFAIPTEGDNDADFQTPEVSARPTLAKKPPLTESQLADFVASISASASLDELKTNHAVGYKEAYMANDKAAIAKINAAKDARKVDLTAQPENQ